MATHHPLTVNQFQVEAGFNRVGFARVLLPRLERDVIRYREGGDRVDSVRQLPGLLKLGDCVLERGVLAADNEFFVWMQQVHIGVAERRDVVVRLLDAQFQPTVSWVLRNAFPVALEWSMLDAQNSGVLIESLRLAVEGVDVTMQT
jgi:phage tail-like protein